MLIHNFTLKKIHLTCGDIFIARSEKPGYIYTQFNIASIGKHQNPISLKWKTVLNNLMSKKKLEKVSSRPIKLINAFREK